MEVIMSADYKKNKGLTLTELIITLSVASILLAIAAPSFSGIIKNNRMVTQINELVAGLNLARSEAIKQGADVTVCMSNDSTSCSGTWSNGWIVFSDPDRDANVDAGEIIHRVYIPPKNGAVLTSSLSQVTFNSEGFSVGYDGSFLLCDDRGDASAKGVETSETGSVRTAQPAELSSC